ncbi:MerR family transcriptional regulator [Propionibacteriaceae bacterium Y1700]|uniref:MerR family transcriptional regulator n=1 Tax=Microlunatus sp. Y1700 TaxID=3418487 RepID=UPI003DA73988
MSSTSEIAREAGCSVQQVRRLEELGVIPPAGRRPNGYRVFGDVHLVALRAYRQLSLAIGPVAAQPALRELLTLPAEAAAVMINSWHLRLAREREDALAAQRALSLIAAEAAGEAPPEDEDALSITQLAQALGVRTSTLRHWEQEDLVHPERVTSLAVRSYPPRAVREARLTATLRAVGHPVPAVRATLESIRRLTDLDTPTLALRAHLAAIDRRMVALVAVGSDLLAVSGSAASKTGQPGA